MSEFRPGEVEALVGQETERELQTGEQEQVAEINQTQRSELLHSCGDVYTFYLSVCQSSVVLYKRVKWVLPHRGIQSEQYSLSAGGGSLVRVTAEKWNRDNGFRRSLESLDPEDEAWDETRKNTCVCQIYKTALPGKVCQELRKTNWF